MDAGIQLDVGLLEGAPGLSALAERLALLAGREVVRMRAEEAGRTVIRGYRQVDRRATKRFGP